MALPFGITAGQALSAGASILGSVFGSNDAKKQRLAENLRREQDRQDTRYYYDRSMGWAQHQYNLAQTHTESMFQRAIQQDNTKVQRAVRDAQAAGVHPLFALGAAPSVSGGTGAGGTGVGVPGNPAPPGQAYTGSHRKDALVSVINAMNPDAAKLRKQNARLTEAQVKRAEAEARAATAQADSLERSAAASAVAKADQDNASVRMQPNPHHKPGKRGIDGWTISEGQPTADWEHEYGDAGGSIVGLLKLIRDAGVNLGEVIDADKRRLLERHRRAKKPLTITIKRALGGSK